jgi:alpha-tubulin suppressor-like RCC1 family protein
MNHALILSKNRVYCFGDNSTGALGNIFHNDEQVSRVDIENFTALPNKQVYKIYATYYSSFIITEKKSKKEGIKKQVLGFGLNNYG